MNAKIIAVDFDGTLCEEKWPEIGAPNEDLFSYLKRRKADEAKIIMWTCRDGEKLTKAVEWCKLHGLEFDAVNENLPEVIERYGGDTRKIFADEYIDDKMCTRFKLPFIRVDTGITDEIIGKLEHVFGFPLYDWQKRYLKGESDTFPSGRGNGKTFAHCIRLLLGNHEPFNSREIDKLVDENHGPHYTRFFRDYLRDLDNQLVETGFKTNGFYIGERVICSESGVIGDIIKFYKPTASEEQIMVRTFNGQEYHAPARTWKPYQFGFTTSQIFTDELPITGLDLASEKDMTGNLLNPYGEYVIKFANNHGISVDKAHQHPTCQARRAYFNATGK